MINQYGFSRLEITRQNTIGQWILQLLLNGPLQWPGAVNRIEARRYEAIHKGITDLQLQLSFNQAVLQIAQLYHSNFAYLILAQRMEDYRFVHAVDELGTKV